MLYGFSFPKISKDEFVDLTSNTIILCSNRESLEKLGEAFQKSFVDNKLENNNVICYYQTSEYDEKLNVKSEVIYPNTHIYSVNNGKQKIIMTIEPIIILSLKDTWDLWFVDSNNREIKYWSLAEFKGYGSHGLKEHSVIDIYKSAVDGRFGCLIDKYNILDKER